MANAGVVGMAEVVQPSSTTGGAAGMSVAMWSYVWVGVAALILVFLHLAMMGRS